MNAPTAPATAADLNSFLAPFGEDVVYIQNNLSGPTVFTADATRSDGHIVWQGKGDVNGEDIQVVPKVLLNNVQLQASLRKSIFAIVQDPMAREAALTAQQQAWDVQEQRRLHPNPEAIFGEDGQPKPEFVMEKADQNDMLVLDCLRKPEGCEQRVSLRRTEVATRPPLCGQHFGLANMYVGIEDLQSPLVNGKAPVKWVRAQIG